MTDHHKKLNHISIFTIEKVCILFLNGIDGTVVEVLTTEKSDTTSAGITNTI